MADWGTKVTINLLEVFMMSCTLLVLFMFCRIVYNTGYSAGERDCSKKYIAQSLKRWDTEANYQKYLEEHDLWTDFVQRVKASRITRSLEKSLVDNAEIWKELADL